MMNKQTLYTILIQAIMLCTVCQQAFSQTDDSIPATNQSQVSIFSRTLQENRVLWIYTPEGYNTSSESYPVLYLLDGDVHFKYSVALAEYLTNRERMPKMIIVGIINTDRRRDFTPVHSLIFNDKIDSSLITTGGGAKFLAFIKDELLPYMQKHYRVQPFRILAGASLGGLFTVYSKITAPALFQSNIVMSPAFYGGNNKVLSEVTPFLKKNQAIKGRIFLSIGDEKTEKVDSLILQLKNHAGPDLKWDFKAYKEEDHFSMPLRAMYDGLRFIYANWYVNIDDTTNMSDYQSIANHFKKLSTEFGYDIMPGEDFVNSCGYKQLELNNIDNAIDIFSHNVKNYPRSANAYDSMGEAYTIKGNKQLAIECYRKSLALNPGNKKGMEILKTLENSKK